MDVGCTTSLAKHNTTACPRLPNRAGHLFAARTLAGLFVRHLHLPHKACRLLFTSPIGNMKPICLTYIYVSKNSGAPTMGFSLLVCL